MRARPDAHVHGCGGGQAPVDVRPAHEERRHDRASADDRQLVLRDEVMLRRAKGAFHMCATCPDLDLRRKTELHVT